MILRVLMVIIVLAAGAAMVSAIDPNPNNNEASVSLIADPPADPPLIAANITVGSGSSILDPSQNQTQDQASAQSQTSDNSNSNSLTNTNTNIATSTSSATNTNTITNNNTFNPVLVLSNTNTVGHITVSSFNINAQKQLAV